MREKVVEFKTREIKLTEKHPRALPFEQKYCSHPQMELDPDTHLVTCLKCKRVMSAYNALLVIAEAQPE